MIGIILASIGSLFDEISLSIGKRSINQRRASLYTIGFLNLFWGAIFLLAIILFKQKFLFSSASLPTFILRAFLEIIQAHFSLLAILKADRSTFGFIRIITIPLLLSADFFLGYRLNNYQVAGIGFIILTLFLFSANQGLNKKGIWLTLLTALNAVLTLSLYKYNITHFNSVEAEQFIIYLILLGYFIFTAFYLARENPFRFLAKPLFFGQSGARGLASILTSFAYSFAPASLILTAERAAGVFWATFSGFFYFREKQILVKLIYLGLLIAGIILLIF